MPRNEHCRDKGLAEDAVLIARPQDVNRSWRSADIGACLFQAVDRLTHQNACIMMKAVSSEVVVPSLQIRELPEALYRMLSLKARRERRSLAQQAVIELERLSEMEAGARRHQALQTLREQIEAGGEVPVSRPPVDVVREDRER